MVYTGGKTQLELRTSDVICFESQPDDEHGAHSAIALGTEERGAFPPNTLFRLKKIEGPGEWEAPGGVRPRQRLLTVTATYQPPRAGPSASGVASKLCGTLVTLQYGSKAKFIAGLDDLLARPMVSMAHEFEREGVWTDWQGVEYSLRAEWGYVNGAAVAAAGCTPGTRDAENDGKTPHDFLREANAFIRARREAGHGTRMAEADAFLTLEEVLGVRLYSGPVSLPASAHWSPPEPARARQSPPEPARARQSPLEPTGAHL